MRVIVTGGTGYIGSHTILELLKNGYSVLAIDNLSNSSKNIVKIIKKISNKDLKFKKVDITNFNDVLNTFLDFNPNSVLHFAGLKSIEESNNNPKEYFKNNIEGTNNLLKAMELSNCTKFIFTSSATVYGSPKNLPIDETHECNPINPYGISKKFAEKLVQEWTIKNKSNGSVILRCFNPIGAHSSHLLGEIPKKKANNLIPIIADVILGYSKILRIYGNNFNTRDGTCERDFVCVNDIANAHVKALEYSLKNNKCEIINIGSGKNTSVMDIVNVFEEISGRKINKVFEKSRKGDVACNYANIKKAENLLSWRVTNGYKHCCKEFLEWKIKNDE